MGVKWPKSPEIQSTHKIQVLRQNCAKGNDQELMKSKRQTGEQGAHGRAEGGNTKWGEGSAHGAAAALNLLHRKAGLK